jgi:hypothetical protein
MTQNGGYAKVIANIQVSVKLGNKTPEELEKGIDTCLELMAKNNTAIGENATDIEELQRAMGLHGYFAENPPISIQQHHSILSELKRQMLTDFREFYGANKRYMGEWFDKKFEEFFTKMEEKYFK